MLGSVQRPPAGLQSPALTKRGLSGLAPTRRRDPGIRLPSASPNRCGGQGWTSQSARIHSASWRTGDRIEVRNDCGCNAIRAKVAPPVRPGQVIVYNGWEPHDVFRVEGASEVEPGMVKWLHLVSRYGHLRYLPFGWQPVPAERAVFVEVTKL